MAQRGQTGGRVELDAASSWDSAAGRGSPGAGDRDGLARDNGQERWEWGSEGIRDD